jgi:hypothetical protein
MGFKEDAQFARFVTMGAVGTAAVARDLRARFGHRPIELERYAMSNKVWEVKVKRLRIPDLVCTRCGRRVESKGKTKLEIKLSDSTTAGREWSAGGMRDDDLYGFVRVAGLGQPEAIGTPAYFTRASLAGAINHVRRGARKAASEGSEMDVTWPAWVPSSDGTLVGIENDEVIFTNPEGKRKKYWQSRRWPVRHLYLAAGEDFTAEATIVAGVIEPAEQLECAGNSWEIAADLSAEDPTDRYTAVKAAGVAGDSELVAQLEEIATSSNEDWRIKLEAMASLARAADAAAWVAPIRDVAANVDLDEAEQMEATFILSEIPAPEAADALAMVAEGQPGRHNEVRAAAAWGLGTGACAEPERTLELTTDSDDRVALHAAAGIQTLSPSAVEKLRAWLRDGDRRRSSVAAALLAHHGQVEALLDAASEDGDARLWAIRALGDLPPAEVRQQAGESLTSDLLEDLAPLWVQHEDWLRTPENEGALPLLAEQQVRFEPTDP